MASGNGEIDRAMELELYDWTIQISQLYHIFLLLFIKFWVR